MNLIVFPILQVTHPVPYCFRPNVVLFKSHAKNFKVWILLFFSRLHSISLVWCLLRNLFSFNFWARLSLKKCWWKSLECSLASEFSNQNFTKMWSIHPCHVWFLWLMQSWFPISYSKQWYIFFPKIFGETQDEVSIFILLHTIIIIFFFWLLPHFFHKILLGDLFSGTIFWSSFGMESYGGWDSRRGWCQMRGDLEKMTTKAKNASLCTTAQLV